MATLKVTRVESPSRKPAPKKRPPPAMPRLAKIRLEGAKAFAASGAPAAERGGAALGSVILICGAAVAGAAFIGGSLFDVREAFARFSDGLAAHSGMAVRSVEIAGVSGERAEEVRSVALQADRRSLLAADPSSVRTRVESLDWVERAQVKRLWPSALRIEVERRRAVALWELDGALTVVDAAGERVHGAHPKDHRDLPRLVGPGAGPAAAPILAALETEAPTLAKRVSALVRVSERRFDVRLKDGAVIALPAERPVSALRQAEALQARHRLFDRGFVRVDMRDPARIAARFAPEAAPEA